MKPSSPFGFPQFDPSKMDPKLLMQFSQVIQQLPPDQLGRMQTLMHNMMAGFDVTQEMAEFEKNLPPGFREKLTAIMLQQAGAGASSAGVADTADSEEFSPSLTEQASPEMNVREARLTILRGVAGGQIAPEEAEKLLFGT